MRVIALILLNISQANDLEFERKQTIARIKEGRRIDGYNSHSDKRAIVQKTTDWKK